MNRSLISRRACSPMETVGNIRNIFAALSLNVQERWWELPFTRIHCVNLQVPDYPRIVSSGKGVNRELALASAHAELLERLQSRLHLPTQFGIMPPQWPQPVEEDALAIFLPEHLLQLFPAQQTEPSPQPNEFPTLGWRIFASHVPDRDEPEYLRLPEKLIHLTCGSNGIASGNTLEEAMVHASCEVFERYVMKSLFLPKTVAPTVAPESIQDLFAYQLIEEVEALGYQVTVKDCTLGGKLPVMAVIVENERGIRYAFGSNPNLDLCLQRCLTELYQEADDVSQPYTNRSWVFDPNQHGERYSQEMIRSFLTKREESPLPKCLLETSGDARHEMAFVGHDQAPEDDWTKIKGVAIREFGSVYTQDLSLLGFPTVRVYIPGISEIHHLSRTILLSVVLDLPKIKAGLLRLPEMGSEEAAALVELLEKHVDHQGRDDAGVFFRLTDIHSRDKGHLEQLTLFGLLGLLHEIAGNEQQVLHYYSLSLQSAKNRGTKAEINYASCRLAMREMVARGENELEKSLQKQFEWLLVRRVMHLYANPEETITRMNFPICGECGSCPHLTFCRYEPYHSIVAAMSEIIPSP